MALSVQFVRLNDTSTYFNLNSVHRITPQADGTARFYYEGENYFTASFGANLAAAKAGVDALITPTAL